MLSKAQNDLITQTGPGTPGGRLLRSYWQPIAAAENRYLQDREEMRKGGSFCGMGEYFPAQDAFAIETQGAIRDRTREHLGSTDIVIAAMQKTLLRAISQVQEGMDAPGLLRSSPKDFLVDFVCCEGPINDDEDGPTHAHRLLAHAMAEQG